VIKLIFEQLFENLAILISIIFLSTSFIGAPYPNSSIKKKILRGIIGGILCNILMHFSIKIGPSFIVDLRHIPIYLLSFYGGALPALIAMIFTIVGRLIIGVNSSAYASIIFITLSTTFSLFVSKSNFSKNIKIFCMLTFSNILLSIMTYLLFKEKNLLEFELLISYWIISYLAGYVAFYTIRFIREREILFDKYKSESMIDGLTGLNNFRQFDEIFNCLVNDLSTRIQNLSLLYIDIDFFKKINDTYGHYEGDFVLKELGIILKNYTRSYDTVSRNGGEEFTVLLPDCKLDGAIEIAERIRKSVEENEFTLTSGEVTKLTISIGVSSYKDTTNDPFLLIEDADKALYRAKKSGRNKVCYAIREIKD
jgi:diguanylate cyclase